MRQLPKIGPAAAEAAEAIRHYVTTRFPAGHDVPAHPLDETWFADAIQKAIDKQKEPSNDDG